MEDTQQHGCFQLDDPVRCVTSGKVHTVIIMLLLLLLIVLLVHQISMLAQSSTGLEDEYLALFLQDLGNITPLITMSVIMLLSVP